MVKEAALSSISPLTQRIDPFLPGTISSPRTNVPKLKTRQDSTVRALVCQPQRPENIPPMMLALSGFS
jgi:hypothetical protein